MLRIFAFVNHKGGVAKTTTVSNLAAELASRGVRVLMIDADPQSSLSVTYDCRVHDRDAQADENWLCPLLISRKELDPNPAVRHVHETYPLYLIPSGYQLFRAEKDLFSMSSREHRLKKVLARLKGDYDYVFIDCPPALNVLTENALVAAHFAIIPVECEFYALDGIGLLIQTITDIQRDTTLNPRLRVGGVIVTKYDMRKSMHAEIAKTIAHYPYFTQVLFRKAVPTNATVADASSDNRGYAAARDRHSPGAKAYAEIATLFMQRFPIPTINTPTGDAK